MVECRPHKVESQCSVANVMHIQVQELLPKGDNTAEPTYSHVLVRARTLFIEESKELEPKILTVAGLDGRTGRETQDWT